MKLPQLDPVKVILIGILCNSISVFVLAVALMFHVLTR